jgi:L-arabinose isomerase
MGSPWRPRIGLVTVRFTLFDAQMGPDFPARMHAHAARSRAVLEGFADVVAPALIESEADAAAAGQMLAGERLDAVVFAPAMAAPPSYAVRALADVDAPIVIWNAPAIARLPDDLHQDEATVHSTSVGAVMFGNVLVRDGRPAPVVTAGHDDADEVARLERTVRAAATAGSLRGSTLLRVGDPIPGYLDVEASAVELARIGVTERAVERADWESLVASVGADEAAAAFAGVRHDPDARWTGDGGPGATHSGAVAVALERAASECGAVGGTVNCHGPWFRTSEVVGVPACLAVVREAAAGRAFSCTGDQPTAIALLLARRLAGAALYCECYTPESSTGLVLVAAGGEGDPAWADPDAPMTLEANDHYPGARGEGTSVAFGLRRGPATLLSLSPTSAGWVLAWATGAVEETRYHDMRGPNGMFRFDSGPGDEAISRWISSGATHHNALAPGRLDLEIPILAGALGIDHVRV